MLSRGHFLRYILFFSFFVTFFSVSPERAFAATRTWDGGGGVDTSWSTCANWSSDTCPTTADIAAFTSTSLTDTTITSAVSVLGIDMDALYTGTITQAAGAGNTLTVGTSDWILDGGTFVAADAAILINDRYTQTGGTFTGGTGSFTVSGATLFTLSGGTYTASSGTTTFTGTPFTQSAGTFTHNSGTVVFDGSVAATWNVPTSIEFYNLTVNTTASGHSFVISTGDTLNVNGTLILTNGAIGTGTLAAKGDVTVASAWGYGSTDNGTLTINGSSTQTVTLAPQSSALEIADQFTINNASATVSGTGTAGTIYFDKVTVQAGTLALTEYNPLFAEAVTVSGGTLSYTSGNPTYSSTFAMSSGTYTGGTGAHHFNSATSFTLSGGTFTATSGTTTFSGTPFTHTAGGTFTHNSGTVVFDGSVAATWNVATSEEFYHFTINTSAGAHALLIASGDTLNVNGTLTLTDGSIGTGTLAAKGDVTVAAAWGHGSLNNGTLTINGSSAQAVTIAPQSSAIEIADQFTVNNASATVSGTGATGTIYFDKVTVQAGVLALTGGYSGTFAEAFVVSGGTFTAGSGTIDHNGAMTISSGVYTATSGTTSLSAGFTHSGGTFTHSSGTFNLDPGGGITLDLNSTVFYHVTTNTTVDGSIYTLSASDSMYVEGDLTQNNGRFGTSSATIFLSGNLTLGAGFDTASSGAALSFIGTGTQSVDAAGVEALFDFDTTVNKSSGEVRLLSNWTFNNSNQDLTIQEGTFDLNGFNLTVQGSATEKLVVETGGNLQLQGGETLTADSASYPQLDSGSTVTYDGTSGPYTLKDYTYHHLVIAGGASSVFTQAANESYAGNVTITSGILSQGGFTTTVTGTFSNSGTLRRLQTEAFTGTMDVDSGTVEYVGDNDAQETVTITDFGGGGTDYYHLKINDTNATKDVFALGAALTLAGTLQVTSAEFQQSTYAIIASALTVDGGTFTGGSGAITTSGAVTMSAGTLTSTSNTLSVSGAWTHTAGGTFAHNSGTVSFTGNSSTADVSTTETFSALTLNKTDGQTLTIASGDTLVAVGTLTFTDGGFATGDIQAQGNVVVSSTWDAAGSGELIFGGTAGQTFTLTGATAALDNPVTITKSSGTVALASAYTLDHANADFTLTLGTFSTENYAVTTSSGSDILLNGGLFSANDSSVSLSGLLTIAGGTYAADDSTPTYAGGFVLSSGTYSGSSNGDLFSGALTISGGVFTASDATTTISSAWTHTAGGTFTHNSGVVTFTGNDSTIDVATSESFNGLTINKNTGQTLTIASGDSLTAAGTIALTDGAVGTGTLDARANVTVASTFDGGNAALSFGGSAAQSFDLTGATNKFDGDITVAKSAETVSLASNAVLDASGQDVTITSGTFSANTRNLTVAGNVAVNGGTLNLSTGTIDLNGNVAVGGGTLNMGSATVTLAGDPSYTSGTMTPGTSTVTLDGTNQAITGATTWNNLTKTVVTAATLTFPASTTTTVSGTLTLAGAVDELLSLRSSSVGVAATLAPTTVTEPSYLDIRDITITKSTTCSTSTQGCVNSGGNSGWTFLLSADDVEPPIEKSVRIVSPNGGESFAADETIRVTWTSTGRVDFVNIAFSSDGGETWAQLLTQIPNTERADVVFETSATDSALVRVEGYDGVDVYASDDSDAYFEIVEEDISLEEDTEMEEPVVELDPDIETIPGTPEEIADVASRVETLPAGVTIHERIKLADDGDPTTQADSAIYYIGADGLRHVFPNEAVYRSWFCDFANVRIVSPSVLSALSFGPNITYRPGVRMVKFMTNPKTYAVDEFGTLRWITSEAVAGAIYGTRWVTYIDDLSDAFFGSYTFGENISRADDFDPTLAAESVAQPSDSLWIPGYSRSSAEGSECLR